MRTVALIPLAALASAGLLLREAAPDAWAIPMLARIACLAVLAAALVQLARGRGPTRGRRRIAACLVALALGAALPLLAWPVDSRTWRDREDARLRQRFEAVHTVLLDLESELRGVAREARTLLPDSTAADLSPDQLARVFESLEALATRVRPLPVAAGQLGVQLFGVQGQLLAWTGAARPPESGTRLTHLAGGMGPVYVQQSGIYTLFCVEVRDATAANDTVGKRGGRTGAAAPRRPTPRVLVDLPIEVHYPISNRFLQSRSLAEQFSGGGVETSFVYDAPAIPPYLTTKDLELAGEAERGVQGWGLLRDSTGAPLALCRMNGLPYRDDLERAAARTDRAERLLLVLAVVLGWGALRGGLAAAGSTRLRRLALSPALPIVAIWSGRLLMAFLEVPSSRGGGSLVNPATFAMGGFGGMFRSPIDLLLTALVLAATAAIVFLYAARRAAADPAGSSASAGRGPSGPWWDAIAPVGVAAAVAFGTWAAFTFVRRVAADSNPHLAGPQLDLLSPAVLCLELALIVGVASWLALVLLAAHASDVRRARGRVVGAMAVAVGVLLAWRTTPVTAAMAVVALLCGLQLRTLLRDQRFTSFGLGSIVLVGLTSILVSDAIHREYFRAAQDRARERAAAVIEPGDEMRRFLLGDLLEKVEHDRSLERALGDEREAELGGKAFEVWAGSMLSHLGYSCELRIYDSRGQLASEFAVDMPAGTEDSPQELLEEAKQALRPVVHTGEEQQHVAPLRSYRGAVPILDEETQHYVGAVVVTLPYAQASLDQAASPRTRTPDLLRNLQEEGIGPRVDESEKLVLAWIEHGFVVESSTPYLEVGQAPRVAQPGAWQRLRLVNGDYLVTLVPSGERAFLVGFRLESPLDRLLEWAQIGSFSFAVTLLVLLLFWATVRATGAARHLPLLLVPKRLGFQQKLIVAFLVVSLLPSVVLSVATRDIMRDRSVRRNRDAALAKARSAEAALDDLVRRDLEAVRESDYLRDVLAQSEAPLVRDIGRLEFSQVMAFQEDGRIILDETLSNLSDEQARTFVEQAPRTVFASTEGRYLYLGALERVIYSPSERQYYTSTEGSPGEVAADARPYYVFYRRRLTDRVLRNLAPILGTDISGFLGARLVVSSQKSLAIAGLLPSLVPPRAYTHVQLRRNRYAVLEESAGRQSYFAGYLPLEDAQGKRIGTLAVTQLLQPDEFAIEVERTRELVLGLSTLMFVLTLVLGIFFAARIFGPVRSLMEGTRRIAGGDLGFRLRARSGDEIGELVQSFNEMTTGLQATRRALEERRRYLEAVLGNIASGVIATDAEGHVTAANPAAYRILGLVPGSLQARTWTELGVAGEGRALEPFWRFLAEARGGEVVEIPVHGAGETPPRGRERSAVARSAAARAAAGPGAPEEQQALERLTLRVIVTDLLPAGDGAAERLGRVAIFEDVTELIRSKKLSAWAEMARQVAHEIKNPLTPMKLSAQFMQQAFRDGSQKFPHIFEEGMATIVQQVESLRRIASEFSNFGRVQKLEPLPLDLGDLLRTVTAPYAQIAGLEVELPDGEARGLRVLGDVEGLQKVFRNVLENAREAMSGRGRITMRVERSGTDRVHVRIADRGPGISGEVASRLFEPYFSTKSTGTGLGLAISRSIVEELGGTMRLANRPDGGAEACITLVLC